MHRRHLIQVGLAATMFSRCSTVTATSDTPSIKWRLASSFPKNTDICHQAVLNFSRRVLQLTQGQFEIQVFAANELLPAPQVFDAVSRSTVEIGYSISSYLYGKNKALLIDSSIPFGMTARMQNAWLHAGGGLHLIQELFARYQILSLPGGNVGAQMGGWFRKEVNEVKDFNGLRIRTTGLIGDIFSRLGATTQFIPLTDLYIALEKGTIDATKGTAPYDDFALGLYQVAPYYYFPGFWEGSAMLSFYINLEHWQALPSLYQQAIEVAAKETEIYVQTEYDTRNPIALANLLKNGIKLRPFSKEIMMACYEIAQTIYAEESAKNADFAKIYTHWKAFHNQSYEWFRLSEGSFTNFMYQKINQR